MKRCKNIAGLALVVAFAGGGCSSAPGKAAPRFHFRTMQPQTAFERVEASMEAFANGKPIVSKKPSGIGTVVSPWSRHEGGVYYRFEATLAPNDSDGSVGVSLGLTVLECGMLGRSMILVASIETAKKHCNVQRSVPADLYATFDRFKFAMRQAVYRE